MYTRRTIGYGLCAAWLGSGAMDASAVLVNGSTLLIEPDSYFSLIAPNGLVLQSSITGVDGIRLGSTQAPAPGPSGPGIDEFSFLGTSGMHHTSSAPNVLGTGPGMAWVDFSGWSWTFNGGAVDFNLGSGAWNGNPDGVAEIVCARDCGNGDAMTLRYSATVPASEPNGYAGFGYELHIEGSIAALPLPPALWLLASGLMAAIGAHAARPSRTRSGRPFSA